MKTITIEEVLAKKAGNAVIVDIRPEESFRSGSLEGAVNIPREELEERQKELDPGKPVYVLCHTGDRSRDAAEDLEEAGFDAVAEKMTANNLIFVDAEKSQENYAIPSAFAAYAIYMGIRLGNEKFLMAD